MDRTWKPKGIPCVGIIGRDRSMYLAVVDSGHLFPGDTERLAICGAVVVSLTADVGQVSRLIVIQVV